MKRVIVLVLCVCMLMAIASGCAKEPAPSASASGEPDVSSSATAAAGSTETAGPISPSEDDSMLFDFENAETDIFTQRDLSSFGIPFAEIEIA